MTPRHPGVGLRRRLECSLDDDARVVDSIGSNADIHRKRRTNVVADGLGSIN